MNNIQSFVECNELVLTDQSFVMNMSLDKCVFNICSHYNSGCPLYFMMGESFLSFSKILQCIYARNLENCFVKYIKLLCNS